MDNSSLNAHAAVPATAELLRTRTAAEYVGVSSSTLAKLRMAANRKDGPTYYKVAGIVFYRQKDLDHWIERNRIEGQDAEHEGRQDD